MKGFSTDRYFGSWKTVVHLLYGQQLNFQLNQLPKPNPGAISLRAIALTNSTLLNPDPCFPHSCKWWNPIGDNAQLLHD
jgi:hypothetical protein